MASLPRRDCQRILLIYLCVVALWPCGVSTLKSQKSKVLEGLKLKGEESETERWVFQFYFSQITTLQHSLYFISLSLTGGFYLLTQKNGSINFYLLTFNCCNYLVFVVIVLLINSAYLVFVVMAENENATTPSTCDSIRTASTQSSGVRGRTDPAWAYCREAPELSGNMKKVKLVCLFCNKVFAGGGINRVKQHLAGVKGEVDGCKKVNADVQYQMMQCLKSTT